MKKNVQICVVIIALAAIFFAVYRFSAKPVVQTVQTASAPQAVTVQKVADSGQLAQTIQYPASVVGDQQVTVTAKSVGNASVVNFALGSHVGMGMLLVKIDDTGNVLQSQENGFQSSQVQQSELSKEQAKESLDLAKKNYKDLKKSYDQQQANPALTQTVSKVQIDSAKQQIDIAEIQYDSAKVGIKSTLDDHLITSPIDGFVVGKSVSVGDSISVGQPLVTISKNKNVKIQFFVDQNQIVAMTKGMEVTVVDTNGNVFTALVRNISPAADPDTKRFLIEAFPKQAALFTPLAGTVVSVSFPFIQKPMHQGALMLPLSAITIGQNETYLFVADNGHAKKVIVTVGQVTGETAEIQTSLAPDAQIILSGSKLLRDGDPIIITN